MLETLIIASMLWGGPSAWSVEGSGVLGGSPRTTIALRLAPTGLAQPLPWVAQWRSAVGVSSLHLTSPRWWHLTPEPSATQFGRSEPWRHLVDYQVKPALGGFFHYDIEAAPRLSTGPEISWLTPEPAREGLLGTRVVAPGWCVWYEPPDVPVAVGISTSARFVLMERSSPVVDVFASQARLALFLD